MNFPAQAQVEGANLTLNGLGLRQATAFKVNGTIKDDDFAKAFLAIWLGGDPPNPEIKVGMLGGSCG